MNILFYVADNPPNMRIKAKAFGISPPLGAGYLASVLRNAGHRVKIFDNSVTPIRPDQFKRYILDFNPDMVGFTTFTFSVKRCLQIARAVKMTVPHANIVFGGPHATYLAEEAVRDDSVDVVVAGEGEETACELARVLSSGGPLEGVRGVVYKDGDGKIVRNPARDLVQDIDSLPFPAYDLMDMDKYYSSVNRRFTNKRFASIITSRGCPYLCTFCSHQMFGKKTRMRSPENVVDEIELLTTRYRIGEFIFLDDTFTTDASRAIAICDLLLKRQLKIIWTCNTRADHASKDLYAALYRAGCRGVHIGAESASQEMLDSMKKGITVEEITHAVSLAKKYIGHVVCGFIFGMPGDTIEHARKTIEFAVNLNPDYATFNIATPVPGSQIYEDAVRRGLIDKARAPWEDFLELFSPSPPVLELSEIRREDLVKLAQTAFRRFYFRPGYILGKISKLHSPQEVFEHMRGLRTILNYEALRFEKETGPPLRGRSS